MASSESSSYTTASASSLPRHRAWNTKSPLFLTVVRRMFRMAAYSETSRTFLLHVRAQLDASLGPPAPTQRHRSDTSGGRSQTPECPSCLCFMVRPVCLPCGHSRCKPCLDRGSSRFSGDSTRCPECQQSWPVVPPGFVCERKPTLILQNAFLKWYPRWAECCKHREEGNKFAQEGDFPLAVQWYSKALETGVPDHRVLSNRSRAYLALERLDQALADAELCCKLCPTWPKGHFRRGVVLEKLGEWEQTVAAYLLCLHFGAAEMAKVICQIFDAHLERLTDLNPVSLEELSNRLVRLCVDKMRMYGLCNGIGEEEDKEWEDGEEQRADVSPDLVSLADFECILCTGILFNPVTVACGHSFCQDCLSRSFDHTPFCPICRSPLAESFVQYTRMSGKMTIDVLLENIVTQHFKGAYEEKRVQLMADNLRGSRVGLSEAELLPVFVCTLAFPALPCPLHVFEPRYRLMVRRCMENNSRRFGMCHSTEDGSFSSYGTVLYINTVEYTPDGRSLITTTGEKRFKVTQKGTIDGYSTAKIQFIVDEPVTDQEEIVSLRALQQEVFDHAKQWLEALPVFARLLLMQTVCCPLPGVEPHPECCPNGPMWLWWFVNALPTTTQRKINFLKCTSLRHRLVMLKQSLPLPNGS